VEEGGGIKDRGKKEEEIEKEEGKGRGELTAKDR
jgi:hypothetical protein